MGEQIWIQADYSNNNKGEMATEAPKTLANGTLRDVVKYLLSDEVKQDLTPHEEDVIEEIRNLMDGHRQEEESGHVDQFRPAIYLKTQQGTWHQEGDGKKMANLDISVRDYLIPSKIEVRGEKLDVDIVSIIVGQVPTIGASTIDQYLQ